MKKVILAMALAIGAVGAHADETTIDVVKSMAAAYKKDKSKGMREEEDTCWSAFKPGESDTAYGYCALHSLVGHLIEDMMAEKQQRPINPAWSMDSITTRMAKQGKRLRMTEKQMKQLYKEYVEDETTAIEKALKRAGYSY